MRFARRLVSLVFLLGCLTALGMAVFGFVRHRPRCTVVGPLEEAGLAADGSRLLTYRRFKDRRPCGPVQVWDTHSGRVVHQQFADAEVQRLVRSPDGRHVAFNLEDGAVRLVNWHTGEDWRIDEPRDINRLEFSPKGRWLFVGVAREDVSYLIDVTTRQVVWRVRDYWLKISADDRLLFDRKAPGHHVTVSDLETGKVLGVLPLTSPHYDLSADGRLLLQQHNEPVPAAVEEAGGDLRFGGGVKKIERRDYRVDVWDLATFKHRFRHELSNAGNLQTVMSSDSRFLAMWLHDEKAATPFELSDTATGKVIVSFPMQTAADCDFSHDGSLVYLVHAVDGPKDDATLTMFDTATGGVLWQRKGYGTNRFAGKTGLLLLQEDFAAPQRFVDARTGEELARIAADFPTANYIPMLTADGDHFVIGGWRQRARPPYLWEKWLEQQWPEIFGDGLPGVVVMESATGRELLRVVNRGDHTYRLSDDGGTLITIDRIENTADFVFRAWDVRPTRAWLWAAGVTLAAGVLLCIGKACVAMSHAYRGATAPPVPAKPELKG